MNDEVVDLFQGTLDRVLDSSLDDEFDQSWPTAYPVICRIGGRVSWYCDSL